jgi:Gas vesicle protein
VSEEKRPGEAGASGPSGDAAPGGALQPVRDPQATLSDLIDVLLNKGVYLDLDLIITVADIPLIGVSLRAAIAGMETMLEYGMMSGLDERTRSWLRDSVARELPLGDGEEVLARMAGSHYWEDPAASFATWRPGIVCLTSERLIVFRREPAAVLWECDLPDIASLDVRRERTAGGEEREGLLVRKRDGSEHSISASKPGRLRELVRSIGSPSPQAGPTGAEAASADETEPPLFEAPLWYFEPRRGTGEWRGGTGTCDPTTGFTWKGAIDQRPSIRLPVDAIRAVEVVEARTPVGRAVVILETDSGSFHLASDRVEQWALLLRALLPTQFEQVARDTGGR